MSHSANTPTMTNNHAPEDSDTATLTIEDKAVPAPSKRRLESRRRILAAARQLFVERGYHGTRPQDISKAAGVGHGTFYLHFSDKLECFLSFAEEASAELEKFAEEHHADVHSLEEGIREVLRAVFEYSAENPGVLAAALTDINVLATDDSEKVMPVDRWAEQWAETIEAWAKQGAVAPGTDPMFAGHVLVGMIRQGGAYAYRAGLDPEETLEKLTRSIVRSLTTTP
mgnify:CR=1 FL=1